jgi:hypothetical protein
VGRQVTLDELYGELIDACGKDPATSALKLIRDHLEAGDRVKLIHEPAREPSDEPIDPVDEHGAFDYKVGDPDPTPDDPPWCGARPTVGGPWCTWRPGHDGPHVSATDMGILAVFTGVAEYHENAGKTREEIQAVALPEVSEAPAAPGGPDTVLWNMTENVAEELRRLDKADQIRKRDLFAVLQLMSVAISALAERVEG